MTEQQPFMDLSMDAVPDIIPVLPLSDVVLFPKMVLPLVVRQEEYVQLVDEAMSKDRMVGFLVLKDPEKMDEYTPDDLHEIGSHFIRSNFNDD